MLLMHALEGQIREQAATGVEVTPITRALCGRALRLERPATDAEVQAFMRRNGREMLELLDRAARFRIDDSAVAALLPLLDQPRRLLASARHLFFPAREVWCELRLEGKPVGILARVREDLRSGDGHVYLPVGDFAQSVPISFDLAHPATLIDYMGGAYNRPTVSAVLSEAAGRPVSADMERIGALLLAVLSLLCSPRLYHLRETGFERLNRQRARKGRWPLLAYHEVVIAIDGEPAAVTPATGAGTPRALHFVRAHLRLRSSGRIELVRPHWRGDAQLGIRRPAYRVARSDRA